MPLPTIFQLYVVVNFIDGDWRKPEYRDNHRPAASHWQALSHNVVSSTNQHERDSNSQF